MGENTVKKLIFVAGAFALAVGSWSAHADYKVTPKNDPPSGYGAKEFDWQREWGTIHMNSTADGLNDPGSIGSADGSVGCTVGAICGKLITKLPLPAPAAIKNGIKFDIKRSLLNCMSKPVTNWAVNNPWNSDDTVCLEQYGLHKSYKDPKTLVYLPIFDKRSNDGREWQKVSEVGCQQQVINNCVRDIHECVKSPSPEPVDPSPGYLHPVTHVFTPDEVADLGGKGTQLPSRYFAYTKKLADGKTRIALSKTDPTAKTDRVPDTEVKEIKVGSNPKLKRLKAYRFGSKQWLPEKTEEKKESREGEEEEEEVKLEEWETDSSKPLFVVVDPSNFFDLRLYVNGGKYDTGYDQYDKNGLVATYDTCPILGISSGYSGICDPTGKAGCNLPIYGVGPRTELTDEAGNTFAYNDYPIKWSAYVKKWAVITKGEYMDNIRGREELYLTDDDLNDQPILMLTRADDYCEAKERSSDFRASPAVPDMPCVHYLQYQETEAGSGDWYFMDLYSPMPSNFKKAPPEYNTMQLYSIDEDGYPDLSKPVPGTGDDKYIKGTRNKKKRNTGAYVSFFDHGNPNSVYENKKTKEKNLPALWKADYEKNPIVNTQGTESTGKYLGANSAKGTGIALNPGTVSVIRFPKTPMLIGKGKDQESATCVIATYVPTVKLARDDIRAFIPTNSAEEFQAFVTAAAGDKPPVEGLTLRSCDAAFMPNTDPMKPKDVPTVGSTWLGMTSCKDLAARPACNETRLISAERWCQLENGSLDSCSACAASNDDDAALKLFTPERVDTAEFNILNDPSNPKHGRCFFSALCFNKGTGEQGCPTIVSSGGHVFCLAAETKILMADGKEKEIKKIKAGEKVKTFNARNSRNGALTTGKVKATAITKKQPIIKINDLKITPLHKIVLANGRAVMAKEIKVGDLILKADGLTEEVTSIDTTLAPITVYNLVLEDGSDGYIANGMRVMSYPLLKEMQAMESFRARKSRRLPLSLQ